MHGIFATNCRLKRYSKPIPVILLFALIPFIFQLEAYGSDALGSVFPASHSEQYHEEDIESLTQTHLSEIKSRLDSRIEEMDQKPLWQDGKWHTVLRTRLINLSMWGRLKSVTAWGLRVVGDNARVRKVFFFTIPFLI